MPFTQTRARFVQYYNSAHRPVGAPQDTPPPKRKRDAERIWGLMTAADQAGFLAALDAIDIAVAEELPSFAASGRANQDATNASNAVPQDWDNITELWQLAANADNRGRQRQTAVVNAHVAFLNLINALLILDPILLNPLQARANFNRVNAQARLNMYTMGMNNCQRLSDFPNVPQRTDDHVYKMFESSLNGRRTRQLARQKSTDFEGSRVWFNDRLWQGCWPMGEGNHLNKMGVWVLGDQANQVTDRLLRKDARLPLPNLWSSSEHWHPDPHDPNKQPMEAECQRRVAGVLGRSNGTAMAPRVRHVIVNDTELVYVVYMTWSAHGDLRDLAGHYTDRQEELPEPFLWHVLLRLCEAGLAMETGAQNLDHDAAAQTSIGRQQPQIVHRDLKPENVFLDVAHPTHFSEYPNVQVGDYGHALLTWETDPMNPHVYVCNIKGTDGYLAPEQRLYIDRQTLEPVDRFKLLAHTNVYGVGVIMLDLMVQNWDRLQDQWLGDTMNRVPDIANECLASDHGHVYSYGLNDLVQRCLQPIPANRPTFSDLIREIDLQIATNNVTDGMEDPRNVTQQTRNDHVLRYLPAENYRVGMAIAQIT